MKQAIETATATFRPADPERYWTAHHEVEEAKAVVEDLEERLHVWREVLDRSQRKLNRLAKS